MPVRPLVQDYITISNACTIIRMIRGAAFIDARSFIYAQLYRYQAHHFHAHAMPYRSYIAPFLFSRSSQCLLAFRHTLSFPPSHFHIHTFIITYYIRRCDTTTDDIISRLASCFPFRPTYYQHYRPPFQRCDLRHLSVARACPPARFPTGTATAIGRRRRAAAAHGRPGQAAGQYSP